MSLPLPETAAETTADTPWPVHLLSAKIKGHIERMPPVWVEGQVLNLKRWRDRVFLTLRDAEADASISVTLQASVIDALGDAVADGARVVINARPTWWVKGGTLQLDAREMRSVGIGELLARIEDVRGRLAAEGLFDDDRKVPLPFLPGVVGLICATQGDAEHDVVVNATRRWPAVQFEIRRVTVQGPTCVPETSAALRELDALAHVDVIVIARGGGSFEDLLPFSSETLVRAAAACVTPLVSAIGHEKDAPLLDLVADVRASTPTDAGKRIVPDARIEAQAIASALAAALSAVDSRIDREVRTLLAHLSRPVLVYPERLIDPHAAEVGRVAAAGRGAVTRLVLDSRASIGSIVGRLAALSPQATLNRGFAVVRTAQGAIVRDSNVVSVGETVTLRFARGGADAEIAARHDVP